MNTWNSRCHQDPIWNCTLRLFECNFYSLSGICNCLSGLTYAPLKIYLS